MRIQQLHYIIKIVETGSMNEAAKQLFITQPSLSNAVRDLENEMGIEIFIRNPKGITLTRDGMEFLSYARQVVEQTQLLEERYKNPVAHRELFSVSSQHYAFVVNVQWNGNDIVPVEVTVQNPCCNGVTIQTNQKVKEGGTVTDYDGFLVVLL